MSVEMVPDRVYLHDAWGISALVLTIMAVLLPVTLFFKLLVRPLPGMVQYHMLVNQIMNFKWHVIGIYTTFIEANHRLLNQWHFWTGAVLLVLDIITHLEILRLFHCITNFSHETITKWERWSAIGFVLLSSGSWIYTSGVSQSTLLEHWNSYWIVVMLVYLLSIILWVKGYVSYRLYRHMQSLRSQRHRKLRQDYMALLRENVIAGLLEPMAVIVWVMGWRMPYPYQVRWSILKIGECLCTFHFCLVIFFFARVREFRFGDTPRNEPKRVTVETRVHQSGAETKKITDSNR
jgi:hypothetical protein